MKSVQRIAGVLSAFMVAGAASIALAPSSDAAVCGFSGLGSSNIGGNSYDGHYESGIYNHCGGTVVLIQVDYTYANQRFCVTPGETRLYANPNLGAITNAYYVGQC